MLWTEVLSRWTEIAGFCANSAEPEGVNSEQTAAVLETAFGQLRGTRGAQLVEAMRYKRECRRFDSQWCHCNISLFIILPTLESTQPLIEMKYLLGVKVAVASGWLPYHLHVPIPRSLQGLLGHKLKVGNSKRWVFTGSFSRVMGAFSHGWMNNWQWAVLVFVSWNKGIT